MACVHLATLQLFQKLVESMLGSGSEGSAAGGETVSGGAGEMARLVTLQGLERLGEGGGLVELCCGAEGPAVCGSGLWTGLGSGLDAEKRDSSMCYYSLHNISRCQ